MRRPRALWSRHAGATLTEVFRTHLHHRAAMLADLGVQVREVSTEAYYEQQNRDNDARRALITGMTDAQIVLEHREAEKHPHTEWWGDWRHEG